MSSSLVSPTQARRRAKGGSHAILVLSGTPLAFLLTGFAWLGLSFLLGMALIIGLVHGTPLPHWLKPVHVHGALVGGLLQLAIGGLLCWIAHSSDRKDAYAQSRSAVFLTFNGVTAALLVGFWLGNMTIVGLAGVLLTAVVFSLCKSAWIHLGKVVDVGGIYRIALVALLIGLAGGITMAFRLADGYYAHVRLAHIHLIVLGFGILTFFVGLHQLIAALLRTPLVLGSPVKFSLWFLPAGFATLLGAFLTSAVWLQIAVGCLLFASIAFCTFHLVVSWLKAGSQGTASTDHLLIGGVFLVLATIGGLAISANYLRDPPFLPIGSLHLVAYTHLAFVGFMTQMICGCLSFLVPDLLTSARVQNHAQREAYRLQLDAIMNRWRTIQLAGLSLGTMALSVLASLTWSVPLGSPYIQSCVWIASGLLLASLAVFTAKLAWAVGLRPS